MTRHNPVTLANTFIDRYGADKGIDHLKLQKLTYYTYGWWLAFKNEPIASVGPQVWKLGPVFHPIYSAFASSRSEPITAIRQDNPFSSPKTIDQDVSDESKIVDWIWQRYGGFSGIELSEKTHEIGTPWHSAVKAKNFVVPRFLEMDINEIRAYFRGMAKAEGFEGAVS